MPPARCLAHIHNSDTSTTDRSPIFNVEELWIRNDHKIQRRLRSRGCFLKTDPWYGFIIDRANNTVEGWERILAISVEEAQAGIYLRVGAVECSAIAVRLIGELVDTYIGTAIEGDLICCVVAAIEPVLWRSGATTDITFKSTRSKV